MDYAAADGLRYLFLDFNAFFAAVEQHDEPALRGRPVIVAPTASEHTSAIAASYEARPFGVTRGTPVREARTLCPGLAVRVARHDRYAAIHRELMAEIARHLPLAKVYSIDEAAFRLCASEARAPAALAKAREVMAGIREAVGPALRASIGLAQTRLLAKLAAEMRKPDGLTVLEPDDLPGRLAGTPLRAIPGVGPGVEKRLAAVGVRDFMGLWRLAPKQARAVWGSVQGERFWYALHGYEVDEPATEKSMIGHSRVLTRAHERPEEARVVARALLLKAASRLRHYGLFARALSLGVKLRPDGRWEEGASFSPSQDSFDFLAALDRLWTRFLAGPFDVPAPRLASVTVYLHGLAGAEAAAVRQGDLFACAEREARSRRRALLWAAVDEINADPDRRFARLGRPGAPGGRRVTLARQMGLDLTYLGAKIAFSRVPEEAEFLF